MRKVLGICAVAIACSVFCVAQDYSKAEIFGGFQYSNIDAFNIQRVNLVGWTVAATDYLKAPLGITGEVSGSYGSPTVGGIGTSLPTYTFMFGPTLRAPSEKLTPFVHALFGVAHMSNTQGSYSSSGFSMALGGGVDAHMTKNVKWRVVQLDFLQTRLQDPTGTGNTHENNFRFATGLVFKF